MVPQVVLLCFLDQQATDQGLGLGQITVAVHVDLSLA